MAGIEFWGNDAHIGPTFALDAWDLVYLGGDPLPGICDIKGLAQLELDKKKTKGTNGVRLTVTGYQPGPFEVSVKIWTADQWDFMQAWIDTFWIGPRKARPEFTTSKKKTGTDPVTHAAIFRDVTTKNRAPQVAISITNPRTELLGITSCVVQGVSIPEDSDGGDVKVIKIKLVEHVEPTGKATKSARNSANAPLAKRLVQKRKDNVPAKPSSDRTDLGPKGVRTPPGGGSD
jgi:hypothetical protein